MPRRMKDFVWNRFDDHYVQHSDVRPVLQDLGEIREELNALQSVTSTANAAMSALGTSIAELEGRVRADLANAVADMKVVLQDVRAALQEEVARAEARAVKREASLYRQAEALVSIAQALQPSYSLPQLGGWALSADLSAFLVGYVLEERPRFVLELGSGSSTVLLAMALERNGSGHLISLEHDASFAASTLSELDIRGLSHLVDLIHAPLGEVDVNGEKYEWYTLSSPSVLPDELDLILVDGPPSTDDSNRFPALPVLAGRLKPGGLLVLDDARRADESLTVARWSESFPDYSVTIRDDHEKGTALFVKRATSPESSPSLDDD